MRQESGAVCVCLCGLARVCVLRSRERKAARDGKPKLARETQTGFAQRGRRRAPANVAIAYNICGMFMSKIKRRVSTSDDSRLSFDESSKRKTSRCA